MRKQSRWLMLAAIIGAALAMLAFSACGGGDDDDDDDNGGGGGNTATATRAGGSTDNGDNGDATPTDDGGDNGDGNGGDDIFADLENLSSDLDNVTGKVTYNVTDEDGSTTSMTFYAKPPNSRFDSTDSDGNSSIIISTPDFTYICDSVSESCFSTPGTGDTSSLGAFAGFLSSDVIEAYIVVAEAAGVDVNTSDESINGIDAKCYSWEDDTEDEIEGGKICFNDDGIMVYEQFGDSSGSTSLSASDVSSDVSDSDFEPPYPVTTIPAY